MGYNLKGECRNTGRTHFKKGFTPWNKGRIGVYSDTTLEKMKKSNRKRFERFLHPMKGRHHSEEARKRIAQKISLTLIGNTRTKDKPWSETRRKAQEFVIRKTKTKPVIRSGKEYHPYWNDIRKIVYKRDEWECQECEKHCRKKGEIQCHHIDLDINHNDFSNLITLCAKCHRLVHYSKKEWKNHLKNLVVNRKGEKKLCPD